MKQNKKLIAVLLVAVLMVSAFALCACDKKCDHQFENNVCTKCGGKSIEVQIVVTPSHNSAEGVTYFVETGMYGVVDTDTVEDLLVAVNNAEGALRLFEFEMSGTAVKKIGNLEGNTVTWDPYIAIFTSVEADQGVGDWREEITYITTTLATSNFGVKEMHLEENAIIYFVLVEANW